MVMVRVILQWSWVVLLVLMQLYFVARFTRGYWVS
jgi:hypothetical protein